MTKATPRQVNYRDESVPAHPELDRGHPVVVFGDHRFCAGSTLEVRPMPRPQLPVWKRFLLQHQELVAAALGAAFMLLCGLIIMQCR